MKRSKSKKTMKSYVLVLDDMEVQVKIKQIKNLYLRIQKETGKIKVSAPEGMPMDMIEKFILSRKEWIIDQQRRIREFSQRQQELSLKLVEGEEIPLWGAAYPMVVRENQKKNLLLFQNGRVELHLKKKMDESSYEERYQLLKEWYRQELHLKIPALLQLWEEKIGVSSSEYCLKDMKSQWGSCHIQKKKICLNLRLAKYPESCLEYVIVHELVHLLEASHNQRFKSLMTKFLPDWKERKKRLNQ